MSIINQALQKAQRDQLQQRPQEMPYRVPGQHGGVPRHRWLLGLLGLLAAVVLGALFRPWLVPAVARLPQDPAPAVPTALSATPLASLAPSEVPSRAIQGSPALSAPTLSVPQVQAVPSAPESAPATSPSMPADDVPIRTVLASAVLSENHVGLHTGPGPLLTAVTTPPSLPPAASSATPGPPADTAPADVVRAQTLVQRAMTAQEAGDLSRALTLLEQAVKLDPTAKVAYNSLGNVYYQQRRYQQALAMYTKALALDPEYVKARNNLGSTYMRLAMDARAIDELQLALRTDRSYSLTYYNLACAYARSGKSATAAQYLQQAIALEPQARTWAQTDADFARVRTTPEVQALLGP